MITAKRHLRAVEEKEATGEITDMMLDVTSINPAVFNPGVRTQQRKLTELKALVEVHGILQPVHVVHRPPALIYTLADGHRRVEVAKQLGITKVLARVHTNGTPEELWVTLNKATRKISAFEWMCAWLDSNGKVRGSGSVMATITAALAAFETKDNMRRWLVDTQTSPGIVRQIEQVSRMFVHYKSLQPYPSLKQIGIWMIRHHAQHPTRTYLEAPNPGATTKGSAFAKAKRLKHAIVNDLPLAGGAQ